MDNAVKSSDLEFFLHEVPFSGWHDAALKQTGLDAHVTLAELTAAFHDYMDEALINALRQKPFPSNRLTDKITHLVMLRLALYAPYKEQIKALLGHYTLHKIQATQQLAYTTDLLWQLSGDAPNDFSYYTKRTSLGTIYLATLYYWLQDDSLQAENSRVFLQNRIGNLMQIGKLRRAVSSFFSSNNNA